MRTKLNKACILFLASEIDQAASRSQKSFHDIINFITASHPETTLPEKDWAQLDDKTKTAILERVKRTLESMR